ncbi:VOC family protein [Arboricoccus pini]|nr:VOC family protein [Arboricoccus pini]
MSLQMPGLTPCVEYAIAVEALPQSLAFMLNVLGADIVRREDDASGRMRQAEIRLGHSQLVVRDADGIAARPVLQVKVRDAGRTFARAVAGGATPLRAPLTMSGGERCAVVQDTGGVIWHLASSAGCRGRSGDLPAARIMMAG